MKTTQLRHLRMQFEYSQEYVALNIGISQVAYSKLENGVTSLSDIHIDRLASLYNISKDKLIDMLFAESKLNGFSFTPKDFVIQVLMTEIRILRQELIKYLRVN